jgi:hypothetical protein
MYSFVLALFLFASLILDVLVIFPNVSFFISSNPKDWFYFFVFVHIIFVIISIFITIKRQYYPVSTTRSWRAIFIVFGTWFAKLNLVFLFRFFLSRLDFVDIFYSKFFILKVKHLFSDPEKLSFILSFAEKHQILFSLENVQNFLVLDNISDIKLAMVSVQSELEDLAKHNSGGYLTGFYAFVSSTFASVSNMFSTVDSFEWFLLGCIGLSTFYIVYKLFSNRSQYIAENSKPIKWLEEQEYFVNLVFGRSGHLKRCRLDPNNLNSRWRINPVYDTNDKMLLAYLVFLLRRCQQRLWTGMSWTMGAGALADRHIREFTYSDEFRDMVESNSFNKIQMVYYWTLKLACVCSFDFTLLNEKDQKLLTLLWAMPYLTDNPYHWKIPSSS